MADQSRNGALVVSSAGSGKTALVEHLVDFSCFGEFRCCHQDLNTSAGNVYVIENSCMGAKWSFGILRMRTVGGRDRSY